MLRARRSEDDVPVLSFFQEDGPGASRTGMAGCMTPGLMGGAAMDEMASAGAVPGFAGMPSFPALRTGPMGLARKAKSSQQVVSGWLIRLAMR